MIQPSPGPGDPARDAKTAVREPLLTARGALPVATIGERARQVARLLLATPEVRRAATLTAYVGVGREPGTGPLLEALVAAGKRVLLPVVLPGLDLDWAAYDGPQSLAPARMGLLEPTGPRLGVDAVATADVVIVPALAVDEGGNRLGRGGGCYDRALARVPVGTFVVAVLNAAEVLPEVPVSAHDRSVTAVVTEDGLRRFPRSGFAIG